MSRLPVHLPLTRISLSLHSCSGTENIRKNSGASGDCCGDDGGGEVRECCRCVSVFLQLLRLPVLFPYALILVSSLCPSLALSSIFQVVQGTLLFVHLLDFQVSSHHFSCHFFHRFVISFLKNC